MPSQILVSYNIKVFILLINFKPISLTAKKAAAKIAPISLENLASRTFRHRLYGILNNLPFFVRDTRHACSGLNSPFLNSYVV